MRSSPFRVAYPRALAKIPKTLRRLFGILLLSYIPVVGSVAYGFGRVFHTFIPGFILAFGWMAAFLVTGDDPIGGTQVRRTLAAAIENQQLVPDQRRFGNNRTEPSRPCQSGHGDDHMNE